MVSPLIALIKDQMEHLAKKKIVAESVNSKMGEKERRRVLSDLKCQSPTTRLLYVTPEQCATQTFRQAHLSAAISPLTSNKQLFSSSDST